MGRGNDPLSLSAISVGGPPSVYAGVEDVSKPHEGNGVVHLPLMYAGHPFFVLMTYTAERW